MYFNSSSIANSNCCKKNNVITDYVHFSAHSRIAVENLSKLITAKFWLNYVPFVHFKWQCKEIVTYGRVIM